MPSTIFFLYFLIFLVLISAQAQSQSQSQKWKYRAFQMPRLNLPFADDPRYYYHPAPQKPKTIPLCEYWRILGVEREECQIPMNDDHEVVEEQQRSSFQISLPICRLKFLTASCVKSEKCQSGTICLDFQSQRCCHPMPGTCPTPTQLGYKCMVYTPTSWCTTDEDCKGKMCCPTGCNYNVCV